MTTKAKAKPAPKPSPPDVTPMPVWLAVHKATGVAVYHAFETEKRCDEHIKKLLTTVGWKAVRFVADTLNAKENDRGN